MNTNVLTNNTSNKETKIVVLGSINCDLSSFVTDFPAPNQTISTRESNLSIGGKGLNQAVSAARAGAQVHFIGCVGDDTFGNIAIDFLHKNNVNTTHIRKIKGTATGTANILISENGQNMIAVSSGANQDLSPSDVIATKELIASADILITQLESPLETVELALKTASENNVTSILNPAPATKQAVDFIAFADFITPNEIETCELTDIDPVDDSQENNKQLAANALQKIGAKNIVMTLGKQGCFVTGDGQQEFIPAFSVKAVNTTGAGDVFNGAFAVAIARNLSITDAANYANAASAISVTRKSASDAAPTHQEISKFIREHADSSLSI